MKNKMYGFPIGAATTLGFFLIGFLFGRWDIAWLVFLLNPIFFWYANVQKKKRDLKEKDEKTKEEDDLDF